jgi:hypothetical protein
MERELEKRLEIMLLVRNWFKKLTDHALLDELVAMLASDGFTMKFVDAELKSINDFTVWYERVVQTYFDQKHDIRNVDIMMQGSEAELVIFVNWQARTWNGRDGYSRQLNCDAMQTWQVVQAEHGWKIKKYIVEMLENN